MRDWDLAPPEPAPLGDREVPLLSRHLVGKRVALLVTGGIAAMKAPLLARAMRKRGAQVLAFATPEALRYVAQDALHWSTGAPVVTSLSPLAEHLSDDAPFDAFLMAPATYNSINKLAHGIADSVVTTPLAGALGRLQRGDCAVLVAPTMHGSMHNPLLTRSLETLRELGVRVIPPRAGYGKHNIPHEDTLVAEVIRAVTPQTLSRREVLVLGPEATGFGMACSFPIHQAALSNAVARELWLRGAAVSLCQPDGAPPPLPPLVADVMAPGVYPVAPVTVGWSEVDGTDFYPMPLDVDPADLDRAARHLVDAVAAQLS